MKGINLHGVSSFIHAVTRSPKLLVPHLSVKDLNDIPFAQLHAMGFKGIVFDKDNTLTVPHAYEIVPHIQDALRNSQRIFGMDRVVVFSNSAGSSDDLPNFDGATRVESELKVNVLRHGVKKPRGIDEMQQALQVRPDELIMIGDRYSTDVLFGNSNG
ncbi:HAD phosphatase, family IIIA, variant 2 [Aphanomyces invadans]|nr:HAD phosphatase, family IIIA, variant 2 [Aphanomyces invadans]ETW01985.1 HAD phosphatase, family IIIA, variant 2 [Aphanomyces invadans]|eukprot:XP_008869833.1 HAD phosphatase, family IIIA, variant 2 [Aphanomyces invadans]